MGAIDQELLFVTNYLRATFALDEAKAVDVARWAIAMKEQQKELAGYQEAKARIQEIEDIGQGKDFQYDREIGMSECFTCGVRIDRPEDECACDRLYQARLPRLEELRKKVAAEQVLEVIYGL